MKDGFYYYFNWHAGEQNSIHWCKCGKCNYGIGSKKNINRGEHGVWIGPFDKLKYANDFLEKQLSKPVIHCRCIKKFGY